MNSDAADYLLEGRGGRFEQDNNTKARYTLYLKDGTAVFSSTTRDSKNAVKDVCKYIVAHPTANK